jgi:hypothetical protein
VTGLADSNPSSRSDAYTVRRALDCLVDERENRGATVLDVAHAIAALERLVEDIDSWKRVARKYERLLADQGAS